MGKTITKSLLRKTILQYRKLLDHSVYQERNSDLLDNLNVLIDREDVKSIHTFLPISRNKEVDATPLFSSWWDKGIKIIVSNTDFQTREMKHFYLEEETQLRNNSLDIPEPVDAVEANFSQADMVLVPLLVCDKNNNRIGYGGGFYDQLLSETKALKVGLSLSPALDLITQSDEWDIPLDKIISFK